MGDLGQLRARRELLRPTERVPATLDDQRRHPGAGQLLRPRLLRPARRVQREAQRQDGLRPQFPCRTAGHPGAGAAAAGDHRQPRLLQRRPQRGPCGIEGLRRGRHLPARHPPRLLDQRHGVAAGRQRGRQGPQIARLDAPAGPVAHRHHGPGRLRLAVPGDPGVARRRPDRLGLPRRCAHAGTSLHWASPSHRAHRPTGVRGAASLTAHPARAAARRAPQHARRRLRTACRPPGRRAR